MNIDKKLDELIENNKSNSFDFYEFEELRDSLKDYVLVGREDLKELLKYLLCSDVEKNKNKIMDIAQGLLSEQIKSKMGDQE